MYKKCYATKVKDNKYKIHLWDDIGYDEILWYDTAYQIDDKGKYKNYTLKHFIERIKIYNEEQFDFNFISLDLH